MLFMKGALLEDPKGILVQQTRNVQAARQLRFVSLADIKKHKAAVKAYIREAIAVEKSGARVPMKSVAQFAVPAEFQKRLDENSELAEAFFGLSPGRQKGYLLHFNGAKQSATRTARVARHALQDPQRAGARRLGHSESGLLTRLRGPAARETRSAPTIFPLLNVINPMDPRLAKHDDCHPCRND